MEKSRLSGFCVFTKEEWLWQEVKQMFELFFYPHGIYLFKASFDASRSHITLCDMGHSSYNNSFVRHIKLKRTVCARRRFRCFIKTTCYLPVRDMTSVQLEEQFRCCICLDIYTDPVSIPCGHNFCLDCIEDYWDTKDKPECPLCKEVFPRHPELRINHAFADIIKFLYRCVLNITSIRIL